MIQLTDQPIDTAAMLDRARHPEAGAVVLFLGTTRELTDGRQTVALDYEAYREMAERQLAELEAEARRRWPVIECIIVHRLGRVPLGEASVAIVVSTPHRADAFAAGQWLIDTLKHDVPIWKREQWADGTTEWVHPGMQDVSMIAATVSRESHSSHRHDEPSPTTSPLIDTPRPRAHQPADQRHRSLQHPLLLLHAERERPLPAARRDPHVRGDRRGSSASWRRWACNELRLTGGEPLVRADLPRLVEHAGRDRPASTTSPSRPTASCSPSRPRRFAAAGLQRLNISLDTLSEETFQKIARREGLDRVLAGIAAAQDAGFEKIRLNAVAIHGLTEDEIVPLARFARERGLELRFIEFMPLDAEQHWQSTDVLDGDEIRRMLEAEFGPLVPVGRPHPSQPATDFDTPTAAAASASSTRSRNPSAATATACGSRPKARSATACSRPPNGTPAHSCAAAARDDELADLVRDCVLAKAPAHGIDTVDFVRPERAMYQIGG